MPFIRGMALVAAVAVLGGCSFLHPYDKAADQIATKVKTDYESSKIVDALKGQQANYENLETREVAAQMQLVAARRDTELLSLVSDSTPPFTERMRALIDRRLGDILGRRNPQGVVIADGSIDAWNTARAGLVNARIALDVQRRMEEIQRKQLMTFRPQPTRLAPCDSAHASTFTDSTQEALIAAAGDPQFVPNPGMLGMYPAYVTRCKGLLDAQQAVWKAQLNLPGEVGAASRVAAERAQALAKREADVKLARQGLKDATEKIADRNKASAALPTLACDKRKPAAAATAAGAQPAGDGAAKTAGDKGAKVTSTADAETKADALCIALDKLRSSGDPGAKVLAEEQLDKMEQVLAALSGAKTTKDGKELPAALALLSTGSRLGTTLANYETASTLPELEPLIIEKQLAASRLAYATQGHEIEKLRVALANERFEALFLELSLVIQASAHLGSMPKPVECSSPSPAKQPPEEATRRAVYCAPVSALIGDKELQVATVNGERTSRVAFRALSNYAESYSVARARAEAAEVRLIALDYRDSLNRSEAALASWDALIGTPIAQLQAYHASGITPAEIAQFLQAFGLLSIADRVK